MDGKDQESN